MRMTAINVLGQIGPASKDAIPLLLLALKDRDQGVRNSAARAIQRIDPEVSSKLGL